MCHVPKVKGSPPPNTVFPFFSILTDINISLGHLVYRHIQILIFFYDNYYLIQILDKEY